MDFEIGKYVVYGVHGVCRIIGKEKQLMNRKRTEYLVLEPHGHAGSRYYIPAATDLAAEKLKEVLSDEALRTLLQSEQIREEFWIPDEHKRKQYYRELLVSGDREKILQMIVALYRYREAQYAAGKKFHQCDDNFLRDAEKLMVSEISLVWQISADEARNYLRENLK